MANRMYRVEDILAESDGDDDLDVDVTGISDMDINSILNSNEVDDDDIDKPSPKPIVPGVSATAPSSQKSLAVPVPKPRASDKAAAIIAGSDNDSSDDELVEGSERYNQLLDDVLHEEDSDDDSTGKVQSSVPSLPSSSTTATPSNTSTIAPSSSSFSSASSVSTSKPVTAAPAASSSSSFSFSSFATAAFPFVSSSSSSSSSSSTTTATTTVANTTTNVPQTSSSFLAPPSSVDGPVRKNSTTTSPLPPLSSSSALRSSLTQPSSSSSCSSSSSSSSSSSCSSSFSTPSKASPAGSDSGKKELDSFDKGMLTMSSPSVPVPPKPRLIEPEGQARLAAAAVYEEKMSRVGNFTMISPLQEKRRRSRAKAGHQVLKIMVRPKIKEELEKWRTHTGLPTASVIHYKFIAIGTSRGVILVFDHFESLVMVLGKFEDTQGRGAVTALDMSPESEHLVAGHQKGQVVLWDLLSKTSHKVITDSSASAVTQVRYTKRGKPQFVVVHQDGTLNLYTLEKLIFYSWAKQCLLQGGSVSIGPILACAMLLPNPAHPHYCDSFSLLAFATDKSLIVVALDPQVRILLKLPRESEHLPHLAWRSLRTQDKDQLKDKDKSKPELIMNPVLAVAQGDKLQLYVVAPSDADPVDPSEPLRFLESGEFTSSKGNFTFIHWLGGQVMVVMTSRQEMKVIDPFELTELESLEIKDIGLIYHEFFINPVTNKPDIGYDNAIRGSDDSLLLLGMDNIVEAKVLSWSERVSALVEKGQWIEALALGLDFYEGVAKAAIGLPKSRKELKHTLADRIVQLLMSYVDLALGGTRDKASTGVRHVELIAGVAIDYCVIIERTDILFRDIYIKFLQAGGVEVFLELLEPYILNDKINHLSPEVMKAFVDHYHKKGKLVQVEQCITHMNIESLDFQQVVVLCRERHLFSALIYVYNKGLNDYASPLEDVFRILTSGALLEQPREQIAFKMLLYIHCCLIGQGFPRGDIDPQKIPGVKAQILATVFAQKDPSPESRYPWLRYLLHLDTEEFLSTLNLAFASEDWRVFLLPEPVEEFIEPEVVVTVAPPKKETPAVFGHLGFFKHPEAKQEVAPAHPPPEAHKKPKDGFAAQVRAMNIPTCQSMLDIMTSIFVDPTLDPFVSPTPSLGVPPVLLDHVVSAKQLRTLDRLTVFFNFCAKTIVQYKLTASITLLKQLFTFLTWPEAKNRPQRERDLMGLLEHTDAYDVDALIEKARHANFYDVCVYLYKKKADYVKVLECYLKAAVENPSRVDPLFDYIPTLIGSPNIQGKEVIKSAILTRLPELINVNSDRTAKLVVECFADENDRVVKALATDKAMQFKYLKSIMATRHTGRIMDPDDDNSSGDFQLSPELHELYISLLCQFAPSEVYPHISSHHDYNIDNVLKLCQKFGVNDASAYLLERTGDVKTALDLTLQTVDQSAKALQEHISKHWREEEVEQKALQPMRNTLSVAIMLCERSLDSEQLWFDLLDRFFKMQRALTEEQRKKADTQENQKIYHLLEQSLFSFVRMVLSSMMNHVPFAVILRKITTDHQSNPFREFRETIQGMLDSYSYEQSILKTANRLLAGDMYRSIRHLHQNQARAFRTLANSCGACSLELSDLTSTRVVLYDCGHAFHINCCGRNSNQCPLCGGGSRAANKKVAEKPVVASGKPSVAPRPKEDVKVFDKSVKSTEYILKLQAADRSNYPVEQEGLSRFDRLLHRFDGDDRWSTQLQLAPRTERRNRK